MTQLTCDKITINYGNNNALRDVSFDVQQGDYLCIVGSNGSGKSTLLKGMLGLININSGKISYGDNIKRNELGYLPQQTVIQRDFPASVYEVVLSGCLNVRPFSLFYSKQEKEIAKKNLEKLNISHLAKESYRNLSGGQQQRVMLARALCATKKLLVLDEPITGLDPEMTNDLYEMLKNLNQYEGITIITTSHDISASVKYSNKILHLDTDVSFFGDTSEYIKSDASKRFLGGQFDEHIC